MVSLPEYANVMVILNDVILSLRLIIDVTLGAANNKHLYHHIKLYITIQNRTFVTDQVWPG